VSDGKTCCYTSPSLKCGGTAGGTRPLCKSFTDGNVNLSALFSDNFCFNV
jgi:hypothetical protein